MGRSDTIRLITALAMFTVTAVLLFNRPVGPTVVKRIALVRSLEHIGNGWQQSKTVPLDQRVINALELDDYVFQEYFKNDRVVSLYIGYYFTAAKVGAAHDPLVCFPGQGWIISDRGKGKVPVDALPGTSISYSLMSVERELEKILILYWFQAFDKTSDNTFLQKIYSFRQKVTGTGEDNAFVRISCAVKENNTAECRDTLVDFASSLYPSLVEYVKGDGV